MEDTDEGPAFDDCDTGDKGMPLSGAPCPGLTPYCRDMLVWASLSRDCVEWWNEGWVVGAVLGTLKDVWVVGALRIADPAGEIDLIFAAL
ncbi:hypothetical protein HG530_001851 [Fusarium avenaceum]|nr:hypothetical protein HG530_001851 [Fusarium avenaceum]